MPNEDGCNIWGGGPAMQEHWDRLWWNVKHIFDFKNTNPFKKDKNRKAYQDIHHAMVNVSVEYCRACPYRAGHYLFFSNMAWIAVAIATVVVHFTMF